MLICMPMDGLHSLLGLFVILCPLAWNPSTSTGGSRTRMLCRGRMRIGERRGILGVRSPLLPYPLQIALRPSVEEFARRGTAVGIPSGPFACEFFRRQSSSCFQFEVCGLLLSPDVIKKCDIINFFCVYVIINQASPQPSGLTQN